VEASDLDNPNSRAEPKKGGFQATLQLSVRERPRSPSAHAWGVDDTVGVCHNQRATGKETTRKGHVSRVICMHGT